MALGVMRWALGVWALGVEHGPGFGRWVCGRWVLGVGCSRAATTRSADVILREGPL